MFFAHSEPLAPGYYPVGSAPNPDNYIDLSQGISLGHYLRYRRLSHHLSLRDTALTLGIKEETLRSWEHNLSLPAFIDSIDVIVYSLARKCRYRENEKSFSRKT